MTFKNYIDSPCGFRYIYDNLEILSSPGRRELLNSKYITSETILNESYNNLIEFYNFFKDENLYKDLISLQNILSHVNDIKGSLDNLSNNCILDDIELYEIKMLALYAINLKTIISSNSLNYI